jgi:hypothetical protein
MSLSRRGIYCVRGGRVYRRGAESSSVQSVLSSWEPARFLDARTSPKLPAQENAHSGWDSKQILFRTPHLGLSLYPTDARYWRGRSRFLPGPPNPLKEKAMHLKKAIWALCVLAIPVVYCSGPISHTNKMQGKLVSPSVPSSSLKILAADGTAPQPSPIPLKKLRPAPQSLPSSSLKILAADGTAPQPSPIPLKKLRPAPKPLAI